MNSIYFPADELGDVPGACLELAGHVELGREEDVQVGLQMRESIDYKLCMDNFHYSRICILHLLGELLANAYRVQDISIQL